MIDSVITNGVYNIIIYLFVWFFIYSSSIPGSRKIKLFNYLSGVGETDVCSNRFYDLSSYEIVL